MVSRRRWAMPGLAAAGLGLAGRLLASGLPVMAADGGRRGGRMRDKMKGRGQGGRGGKKGKKK